LAVSFSAPSGAMMPGRWRGGGGAQLRLIVQVAAGVWG